MIEPGMRVLAIVVARIGDTLLVTPALRALKAACGAGELHVMAHPKRMDLLRHLPFVDRLSPITPFRARLRGRLGARRHDVGVVWADDEAILGYALRAARRVVAFRRGDASLDGRLAAAVARPGRPTHAVIERLMLAEAAGARCADPRLAFRVTEAEAGQARRLVASALPGTDGPLVGLQIQSFPTKRYRDWPAGHFAQLLDRLFAASRGARALVLGDAQSEAAARALVQRHPERVASLAGRLSLRELAAVLACLDLYVGVDTGPTHLAGALGIPMVALYHCRHRGSLLAPLDHPALTVIEHPAADADCTPQREMAEIGVDRVWDAVAARLFAGA